MMGSEWYYAREDERSGPCSSAYLLQLAQSGKLRPEDKVWKVRRQKWVRASLVRGLFPTLTTSIQVSPNDIVESKPPSGEILTNAIGMKLAWIPPGTFMMGSPDHEPYRIDNINLNEQRHKV